MPESMDRGSLCASKDAFEAASALAEQIATSDLIPKDYQGKPANCLIALDAANRLGCPILDVMEGKRPAAVGNGGQGFDNAQPVAPPKNRPGRPRKNAGTLPATPGTATAGHPTPPNDPPGTGATDGGDDQGNHPTPPNDPPGTGATDGGERQEGDIF